MATAGEALSQARALHQAGRLQDAEQLYRHALAADPSQPDAWHMLGVLAAQCGDYVNSAEYIRSAIKIHDGNAIYHSNLGEAYRNMGLFAEAVACCERAVRMNPDFAAAHNGLGLALRDQKRLEESRASLERAVQIAPTFTEAHYNLGLVFKELAQPEAAMACFGRVLQLDAKHARAVCELGTVFSNGGRSAEAIDYYLRAVAIQPDYGLAHYNLGVTLFREGRLDEAVTHFQRASELMPDSADPLNSLGKALQDSGRIDDAIGAYQKALALAPDHIGLLKNLGHLFKGLGKISISNDCFRRALQLDAYNGATLDEVILGLQTACDWKELPELTGRALSSIESQSVGGFADCVSPFVFVSLHRPTPAEHQHMCATKWTAFHFKPPPEQEAYAWTQRKQQGRPKITIGYLSSDFRHHAIAYLVAELLENHDRGRFEIIGYSHGPDDGSAIRARLVKACDQFVDLQRISNHGAARRIAADCVDILVDLNGHTYLARTQILAHKPAPIQVNYLGFAGTIGAPYVDYILVDDFVVPADQQEFYTERLVHLPGCYQVNDSRRVIAQDTPSRAECGLPAQGFVFCCFNNTYKITPEMFDIWMELLKAAGGSVLWLFETNDLAAANLRREAESRGVAAERLIFAPHWPSARHLARQRLANLFLDTFPYNAHTTASDALWSGCPVLTRSGESFVSRVAGSLLRTIGLPELITTTRDEYQALALRLAMDPSMLADLRTKLAANRLTCGLFDGGRFAKHIERAYAAMWELHVSGQMPRPLRVADDPS